MITLLSDLFGSGMSSHVVAVVAIVIVIMTGIIVVGNFLKSIK